MKKFEVVFKDDFSISVSELEGIMNDSRQTEFADMLMHNLRLHVKDEVNNLFNRLGKASSVANEMVKITFETLMLHEKIYGATEESEDIKKHAEEVMA